MSDIILTPEQKQAELQGRMNSALEEINPILEKYELGFGGRLQTMSDALVCSPVLVDKKYKDDPIP